MALPRVFQDEINAFEAEKKAKKKTEQRRSWERMMTANSVVKSAKAPRDVAPYVNRTFQDEIYASEAIESFKIKKQEWTESVEEAMIQHKNEIPLSFWMEMGPDEIRMFGGGELGDLASWVEDALHAQQAEQAIQAEIDKRFNETVDGLANGQAMSELAWVPGFGVAGLFMPGLLGTSKEESPDLDVLKRNIELQVRGRGDEIYEDQISAFMDSERRLLQLMRQGAPEPQDPNRQRNRQTPYERFFLSNGDPLDPVDQQRFWESEMEFLEGYGETTGNHIDIQNISDEELEELLKAREQVLRNQIRGTTDSTQLEKLLTPGRGPGFVEGALGAVGQVMDKGLQFGGWLIEHGGPVTWPIKNLTLPALESFVQDSEQARADAVQEIMNQSGLPDKERLHQFLNTEASKAFQQMEQDEPGMYQEYLRMAGMDPTMALSFFQADMLGEISPEEQTQYLSDLHVQENERINELAAQDFTVGDRLLHLMGVYGRNVPGRLSTMFSVMLTDEDVQGLAQNGQWMDFFKAANEESEKFGHTPSAALEIDGSLTGLMLDLGFGIAFDPTTWVFGPRLGARTSQAATAAQAKALAGSGMVRRMADDVVEAATSPSKGPASMYQIADWLDDVSMGEFLNAIDYNPQALPSTPWRKLAGHSAQEVRVDFVGKLIPDEVRNLIDPEDLRNLADDMLANGINPSTVDEIPTIVLSRGDETAQVLDGVKRVLAAEQAGITHLPFRVRVTDDVAAGTTKVPGYTDDQVRMMEQVLEAPDVRTSNSNLGIDSQRFQYNVVQDRITPDVDVPLGSVEHKGATYSIHKHEGKASVRTVEHQGRQIPVEYELPDGTRFHIGQIEQVGLDRSGNRLVQISVVDEAGNVKPRRLTPEEAASLDVRELGRAQEVWAKADHRGAAARLSADEAAELVGARGGSRPGVKPEEIWYALNADGELAAFYDSSHLIQVPGKQYEGLLHQVRNTAKSAGDDFLPRMMDRFLAPTSSFSDDGVRFLKNAIKGEMKNALSQTGKPGFPIRSLLGEGDELSKPLLKATGNNADTVVRPDAIFPKRLIHGDIDYDAVHRIFERAILERGSVPSGAQYAAVARHFNGKVRKMLSSNKPGRWVQRYMTPRSVTTRYELSGVHAIDKLVDSVYRIWGDDTGSLNQHLESIMYYQKQTSASSLRTTQQLAELQPRITRLQHMKNALGGNVYDDALKHLDDIDAPDRATLQRLVHEEDKALRQELARIDKESGVVGATEQLEKIILDMWDDYNRKHIATNPAWKDLVDETGLVPWEHLSKGKALRSSVDDLGDTGRALPEDMIAMAEELGVDAEGLMNQLSHTQNTKLATQVPLSPLELLAARELGASSYTRLTHWGAVSQMRETALTLHRLWTIDKVFTPATAATVSFDELLRIFHTGGAPAMIRWGRDRALMMRARAQALIHGKAPRVRQGAEYLSPKSQERLRVLNDYPAYLKQLERQTFEQHGLGWTDIAPGQHGYEDAARQWTAGFLQDTGFRAFLRGPEDFAEWFLGPDGERLRRGTVIDKEGKSLLIDAADEYYKGWKTLFDLMLKPARKAGKYDDVVDAWKSIANQIDESGGVPKDLPDVAINYLGPVRGVQRDIPNKLSVSRLQEGFFDRLFMDPVNYRRAFLADLTRTHESSRLRSLLASQGKRVVSNAEVDAMLGLQGLSGAGRTGLRSAINEMAMKSGVVPESYLDDLVEKAVLREIENTLYAFDASSRLGAQSRAVFPFGKPWADMAGFWGREVVRKPVMRGWINQSNAMWLRSARDNGLLSVPPIPNRSSALLSRLAHTDFTIDKGILDGEGGVIPGSEETDFSPLFFLPTEGNNPFSYMLPGLGILPIAFLDYVMGEMYDPVDQPLEYQQLQDELGQFIPSVHFQQGGFISRVLGGGSTAKIGGLAVDLAGMAGQDSYFNLTSEMGDISREIDRTREISALLADPEELQLLIDAKTPEEARLLIQALAVEADKRASQSHLAESGIRFLAPVKNKFDASLAEIQNVWIDATQFDQFAHFLPKQGLQNLTEEQLRGLANDIRTEFFSLDGWERDLLVTQQPSLAVNMVGSWEWTPQAINEGLDGTDYAYRTGGTPLDLARHEQYVRRGLVRPVQPIVRARRILGVVDAAKKSAAKELYTEQVNQVNELLWEAVPEEEKAKLGWVVKSDFAKEWGLETVEEVWFNWRRIEEDLELWLAEDAGIEPVRGESQRKEDETDFDRLRSSVSIGEDWKPWGDTFPGLDEDDVSGRFNEWQVLEVDDKSRRIAEALGIDLVTGMTGENLFAEVQQLLVQRSSPVFDVVRPDYDRYIEDRSNLTGRNMLHEAAQSDLVDERFQEQIQKYLFKHDLIKTRSEGGKITRTEMQTMRDEFLFIMNGAKDQKTDWEGIWREQFQRTYGPLDWEPPEPKSPFDDEGMVSGDVMVPSIRHVVDGDTILVQEFPGAQGLNSVRLLGIRAEETKGPKQDLALRQEEELKDAILEGVQNGDNIYLVRDPRFGDTDHYGRMLAWLWIGDTPFYKPEDLLPTRDPGESNR